MRLAARLRRDRRGATMVEFAFVAPLLVMVLLVLFDFGYTAYATSVLEGTLHRAARMATIGDKSQDQIDAFVTREIRRFSRSATPGIVKKSYSEFSGVGKPEKYKELSVPANNRYDKGVDCFFDDNGNGRRDTATGSGKAGLGGSDQIVFYEASMEYDRLVPLVRIMGWEPRQKVSVNTVLRNQPFGAQTFPECKLEAA